MMILNNMKIFFSDEITKNEIERLKAERAEKNLNAIRTMGIEV